MDQDKYLLKCIREGKNIPASIDPRRHGLIDLSTVKTKTVIFENLLKSGDSCRLNVDEKSRNKLAAILASALINGQSILPKKWQLTKSIARPTIVITDPGNHSKFYKEVASYGVYEFKLFDSLVVFNTPENWPSILADHNPSVCLFNIDSKALSPKENKTVSSLLTTCKSRSVAVLLFDRNSSIDYPGIDTEVDIWKKGDEYLIDTKEARSGQTIETFALSINENNHTTRTLDDGELDKLSDREKRQVKSGVDPQFKMEDI